MSTGELKVYMDLVSDHIKGVNSKLRNYFTHINNVSTKNNT